MYLRKVGVLLSQNHATLTFPKSVAELYPLGLYDCTRILVASFVHIFNNTGQDQGQRQQIESGGLNTFVL